MECSAFGWEAVGVAGFERSYPLPEPAPPDFAALPVGTRDLFERRLDRLPVGRIRSKIGAEAIMSNESRALQRYENEHRLTWDKFAPLGTWHMRAAHDRITAGRPDLLPPRRPRGIYVGLRPMTSSDRRRHFLIRMRLWNFLNGSYTWSHNRAVSVRAWSLRLRSQG